MLVLWSIAVLHIGYAEHSLCNAVKELVLHSPTILPHAFPAFINVTIPKISTTDFQILFPQEVSAY